MTEFTEEFVDLLQDSFDVSEGKAREIAHKAEKYRNERDPDVTPEFLIEEMEKREKKSIETTWNAAIGFLFGPGYATEKGGGEDNPYKF